MIPANNLDLRQLKTYREPSKTYYIDRKRGRVGSFVDHRGAIVQMIEKTIQSERFAYLIYSSQYGIELEKFIGMHYSYIEADLQRVISEALLVDDRIISIENFEIERLGLDSLAVIMQVNTIIGDINVYEVVEVG